MSDEEIRFGNSFQMLKHKISKGIMEGKGIDRISPIIGTDNYEVECDNGDIYLIRISKLPCSVVYPK